MNYDELIMLARSSGEDENWEQCIYYYEKAFLENENVLIYDYLDLALAYLEIGDEDKSLNIIDDVIEQNDDKYIGYHYKGLFYFDIDDKELAIEYFEKAHKLGDNEIECLFNLGLLYDELKQYQNAIKYYLMVLEIDDEHFYANLNLGAIYQEQGDLNGAKEKALKAYMINPCKHYSCYNLGVVYALENDYEKAMYYYQEEVSKEDFCVDSFYNMGIIYKDYYKDYDKSIECYLLALNHNQLDYRYYYNLGCAYCLKKDYEKAFDAFSSSQILNNNVKKYLLNDEEARDFIKTEYYSKL